MPMSVIYEQLVDGASFSIAGVAIDDHAHTASPRHHRAAAKRRRPGDPDRCGMAVLCEAG
jgi:hypothetical protein